MPMADAFGKVPGRVCEGMKDVEVEELMSNVRWQMYYVEHKFIGSE